MAAYAALASLMNNIEQLMKHPHLYNSFDNKQIQSLLEKCGFLLNIIESNRYVACSKKTEDFEREITVAAHAAEDIIESHIVDQIHGGSSDEATEDVMDSHIVDQIQTGSFDGGETNSKCLLNVNEGITMEKKKRKVQTCCRFLLDVKTKVQAWVRRRSLGSIIEEMESLMGKANGVMKMEREKHNHDQQQPTHSTLPLMETKEQPATSTAMVGLDDELEHLLGDLTGNQSNCQTISIVGMGGMGKTTLARNLYENPLIIEHFDVRAWAIVSQQYNAQEIISQLLSSLGKTTSGTVGQLGVDLHKALRGTRYLVILDDIWSIEAWDKVRIYFPEDGSRSRVVLTTRLSDVANACGSSCFEMKLLDEGKSWKLFCEKASFPHKNDPLQLQKVGKEIVRSCKGLALAIVVIGGLLLKSPRTIGYWEEVAANLKSIPNSKEKQESLDVLSLSYGQLPPHLKPCFLYMGAFKEDFEMSASTITRLWIAEGFIRPNGTRVLEEIAEAFLEDLIDRNLILISKRRCNGEVRSCGIHDLLRDLCIKIAEQQEFFHVRKHGEIQSTDRRLICNPLERCIGIRLARSILTRSLHAQSIKCKLLRVLCDPKNQVLNHSPDVLYGNVNLRYLAYVSYGNMTPPTWKLPTSISHLWNIQTLIITSKYDEFSLVVAPSKIWKMRQLRHVKFPQIYLPPPPRSDGEDGMFVLESLQTLTRTVNLRLSEKVCETIPNIKKLHLLYDPYLQGYDDSLTECMFNLDRLLKLESLKMNFQLQAWDSELHKKLAFPSSLRKLSLSHCRLHWNDLSLIGSLPQLQVLYLEEQSVTEGKQWSPVEAQFRQLKFLKIDRCSLHEWNAGQLHFPVLEKLLLVQLYVLEEIPLDIGDVSTLELILVDDCSQSAAISAMRIKEYQQAFDNDALQIQIKIYYFEEESFMEMVETEQLTLSYVKLEIYPHL